MTKDVIVSINGLQIARQNEESEPIEVITAGDYYKKNDKHYIIYDEVAEGFEGVKKCRKAAGKLHGHYEARHYQRTYGL